MHTCEWQAEDNRQRSQLGLDSGLPLLLSRLSHLPGSRFLRDCLYSRVAVLSYVPLTMQQDWSPPVSLQHHFYSDSQPGGWEVVSMLHFPTWITDSFLKDIYCPFQPLLLSPLPSPAPKHIFFLLSLQMKHLCAPGSLHSCSFCLECFPSRYLCGFCLHLLSIFS